MSENPDRVNFTVDPGWNPVPVRVITTGHPLFAEVGALTESVGDAPVTVNPLASVPVSEYWLVTVIFRLAAVAPVRSKVQVIWVAESRTVDKSDSCTRQEVGSGDTLDYRPASDLGEICYGCHRGKWALHQESPGEITRLAIGIGDNDIPESRSIPDQIELAGDQVRR